MPRRQRKELQFPEFAAERVFPGCRPGP